MAFEMTNRQFWKARGRCTECHGRDAFTMAGRSLCSACAEKAREKKREEYRENSDKIRSRNAEAYSRRKENRQCVKCGRALRPEDSGVRCTACRRKLSIYEAARSELRRPPDRNYPRGDNGICYICNRRPVSVAHECCEACYPMLRENMLAARSQAAVNPWRKAPVASASAEV